jgi:hypothetical protein
MRMICRPGFRPSPGCVTRRIIALIKEAAMADEMPPAQRAKLRWIGVALLCVSLFMFVSIIVKTALKGP